MKTVYVTLTSIKSRGATPTICDFESHQSNILYTSCWASHRCYGDVFSRGATRCVENNRWSIMRDRWWWLSQRSGCCLMWPGAGPGGGDYISHPYFCNGSVLKCLHLGQGKSRHILRIKENFGLWGLKAASGRELPVIIFRSRQVTLHAANQRKFSLLNLKAISKSELMST